MGLFEDLTSPPKERYAVTNDNVTKLVQPGTFEDPLTEILRDCARTLLVSPGDEYSPIMGIENSLAGAVA